MSIATNGPQENAPSTEASAVPNTTGTAAAVRLNGRESLNHSAATDRRGSATRRPARAPRGSRTEIPYIFSTHGRPSLTAPPPQCRPNAGTASNGAQGLEPGAPTAGRSPEAHHLESEDRRLG